VLATLHALGSNHDLAVFGLSGAGSTPPVALPVAEWRASRQFLANGGPKLRRNSLAWLRVADGHPADGWYSAAILAELSDLVDQLQARLVVLDSVWLHRYIAPLQMLGCQVVLNTHGIEAALQDELAAANPTPLTRIFAERTHKLEAAAFAAADQVWVPSERDADVARERYDDAARIAIVPNGIELDRYGSDSEPADRFTVTFTGTFGYPPNVTAARRLLAGILPLLRDRVSDARLLLIGSDPTEQMREAGGRADWVEVTGTVDDVAPHLLRASAMAIPLNEGHGTRFKVLEAFASRLPVVANGKAVEGLDVVPGRHYLAAESDAEFADVLAQLAADPARGAAVVTEGLRLVRDRYSLAAVDDHVRLALRALSA
jgi:glycosyltransferase involved in cell wall biosynthesis